MNCPSCNANIGMGAVDVGEPDTGAGIYLCFYCRFCQTLYEKILQPADFVARKEKKS